MGVGGAVEAQDDVDGCTVPFAAGRDPPAADDGWPASELAPGGSTEPSSKPTSFISTSTFSSIVELGEEDVGSESSVR